MDLERAIEEAKTEEEIDTVDTEVSRLKKEKEELQKEKEQLSIFAKKVVRPIVKKKAPAKLFKK